MNNMTNIIKEIRNNNIILTTELINKAIVSCKLNRYEAKQLINEMNKQELDMLRMNSFMKTNKKEYNITKGFTTRAN